MISVVVKNATSQATTKMYAEDTTIREIFEDTGVDYAHGTTSLDGCALRPGDMDKPLSAFGVTTKCFLMNTIKADNNASVKLVGTVAMVESTLSMDDIKKLNKYRKDSLALFKGEGAAKEEYFRVGTLKNPKGSIDQNGACFGQNSPTSGKAIITIDIPSDKIEAGDQDKLKAWAAEYIGVSILNLKKVEEQAASALTEVAAEIASVNSCITIG